MKTNQPLYDQLCTPACLEEAWIDTCDFAAAAGVPRFALLHYERGLAGNLDDLSARLRRGDYSPVPPDGPDELDGVETLTVMQRHLEDLIVQQALHHLLARMLAHPEGGGRRGHEREVATAEQAVGRVLVQRAAGAQLFAGAELGCQPHILIPQLLPLLLGRVADQRLLWLLGQALQREWNLAAPPAKANEFRSFAQWKAALIAQPRAALSRLRGALRHDQPHVRAHALTPQRAGQQARRQSDAQAEPGAALRPLLKGVLKQFGRDAITTALNSSTLAWTAGLPPGRLFTKKSLAATGALLLAQSAIPAATQMWRARLSAATPTREHWPDQPLISLLVNLTLQEFDALMLRAGLPLIRCAHSLALTARSGRVITPALQTIAQAAQQCGLSLRPNATFIRRFDQGVEFFGYRFHPELIAATPLP